MRRTSANRPVRTTRALVAAAGHRYATWHDAPTILRLVAAAERRHPGGLLGATSRYLPRSVVLAGAMLGITTSILAGGLIYDPAFGATIAIAPQSSERRVRRAVACAAAGGVAGVAAVPITLALLGVGRLLPRPVPEAIMLAILAGTVIELVKIARIVRRRQQQLTLARRQAPTVYAGSYVASPGGGSRLLHDLLDACDAAGTTVVLETTGEARIRLFRSVGFHVAAVLIGRRPDRRHLLPPREAKVVMVRRPGSAGGAEVPAALWRRTRRPADRPTG